MKKYLITGFSGFVSRHFCQYLEDNEITSLIKGIDIREPELNTNAYKNIKCHFEKIDLLHKEKLKKVIYEFQPHYILHLASYSSVAFSWKEPVLSFYNNTNIFLNVLETIRKLNTHPRILSIGSSDEYGKVSEKDLPLTEDHYLNPVTPYAVARVSQELLSKIYITGYDLDIVMTRSFNHIGSWQKDIFVIPSFAKQFVQLKREGKSEGNLNVGDVTIVRDFVDVRDVVRAYYLLLEQGEKGEIYNICSGIGMSLEKVVEMMADILNIKVNMCINAELIRPDDNKLIIGSNKKINSKLGWQPQYSMYQSVKDVLNHWNSY